MSEPVRVALLARAGIARDQLRRALIDLGAELVAEGDPTELDPATVATSSPNKVVFSLESGTEAALDRFEHLLAMPGVEVIYDDAEVTNLLTGWDLNRWARHLAAKLLGNAMLLPPFAEGLVEQDLQPAPGAPPSPAEIMDSAQLDDYTRDTLSMAENVPASPSLASAPIEAFGASTAGGGATRAAITLEDSSIENAQPAPAATQVELATDSQVLREPTIAHESDDELVVDEDFEFEVDMTHPDTAQDQDDDNVSFSVAAPIKLESTPAHVGAAANLIDFSNFEGEQTKTGKGAAAIASSSGHDRPAPVVDFSKLSLVEVDNPEEPVPSAATPPAVVSEPSVLPVNMDFAAADLPFSAEDVASAAKVQPGAVLIIAGMGGPDAVRQMLSSISPLLPVPALLYQHLEVGKQERLVEQLAKISRLPVQLAEDGAVAEVGKINVLPAGLGAMAEGDSLRFVAGSLSDLIASLPPTDSVVVMLSGADPTLVPAVLALKHAGGMALAQDPDGCFDPVAAQALRGEGVAVYPAPDLSNQIAARWSV